VIISKPLRLEPISQPFKMGQPGDEVDKAVEQMDVDFIASHQLQVVPPPIDCPFNVVWGLREGSEIVKVALLIGVVWGNFLLLRNPACGWATRVVPSEHVG